MFKTFASIDFAYFSHFPTSSLNFDFCFFCFHSRTNATSSPSPSIELTPAAIALSFLADDEGSLVGSDGRIDAADVAFSIAAPVSFSVTVVVVVDWMARGAIVVVIVIVTVAVSVLLGDVEPDVRLKMTCPAIMLNGAELPLVLFKQVLVFESKLPQQNMEAPPTVTR